MLRTNPELSQTRVRPLFSQTTSVREAAATIKGNIGPVLVGFGLPFALVTYLAFRAGGYDSVSRGEVGLVVWWAVAIGSICGVLPTVRPTRQALAAIGLLAAFAAWTALSLMWTDSSGRTVAEIGRVTMLLGVLVLTTMTSGREALRRNTAGVFAAILIVAIFALASRFEPGWFSNVHATSALRGSENRLFFPLGYWNGLGALCAIGLPLAVLFAAKGRRVGTRVLGAATIPILCLTIFYTFSRTGALAALIGVLLFLMLTPGRLVIAPSLVPGAIGTAILVAAATQRSELSDAAIGVASPQGGEMLALLVVVCLGVGLIQTALSVAERNSLLRPLHPSRRSSVVAVLCAAVCLLGVAAAFDAPTKVSEQWNEFQKPGTVEAVGSDRFQSFSGNNRGQFWRASIDEFKSSPLTGTGSGTFELWSNRSTETKGFVRDAHSLYLETLGELGIVGLILILGTFFCILATGVARAVRGVSLIRRSYAAAAVAGFTTFAVSAVVDWSWEMTVLPVAALVLGAALLSPDAQSRKGRRRSRFKDVKLSMPVRIAVASFSAACFIVILSNLGGADLLNASHSSFESGDKPGALEEARQAGALQPYASAPKIQEAQILATFDGQSGPALNVIREATKLDPKDWRPWFVRAQIAAQAGESKESASSYRIARNLNPNSPLFNQ